MKIQALLNDYLDSHFRPAFRNMKTNLGKLAEVPVSHSFKDDNSLEVVFVMFDQKLLYFRGGKCAT